MSTHSCVIAPHLKGSIAGIEDGKYGRMFPDLPGLDVDEQFLLALGRSGSVMDAASRSDENESRTDNPRIPAAFAFLGQFIAHDITADRSLLQHHANVDELRNFRTPRLDLESVYAAGPAGTIVRSLPGSRVRTRPAGERACQTAAKDSPVILPPLRPGC